MKKICVLVLLVALASVASATPEFLALFKKHYNIASGSELDRAKCMVCHTTPPARNPFGKDVAANLNSSGEMTVAVLQAIEAKDSDGDGVSNAAEIQAGTRPGDPASKPAAGNEQANTELVPKHSFHPAMVHFPIALFIFGTLLESLAIYRREPSLRASARWCLLGGTWALAVVIPTGLIATFRLGYGIAPDSPAFLHLLLGIGSTVLMAGTCIYGKTRNDTLYRVLLIATAAVVGATGHYGGNIVFGG
jgi:uncharacterized membrane protein